MTFRETVISVVALLVTFVATMSWIVPMAYADDPASSEAATTSVSQTADNEALISGLKAVEDKITALEQGKLAEIEAKIIDRDYSGQLENINKKLEKLVPFDNSKDYREMKELVASMSTVSMFSLVAQLLLIGVVLALVFVVSLRTNR